MNGAGGDVENGRGAASAALSGYDALSTLLLRLYGHAAVPLAMME